MFSYPLQKRELNDERSTNADRNILGPHLRSLPPVASNGPHPTPPPFVSFFFVTPEPTPCHLLPRISADRHTGVGAQRPRGPEFLDEGWWLDGF